jgi:hypothetical protein
MTNKNQAISRIVGMMLMAAILLPAVSLAQATGTTRGGMGGPGIAVLQARLVLNQMKITGDAKNKIDGIMQKFIEDLRDFRQAAQGLAPDERRQKMQDLEKESDDTMNQVQAELTSEQKTDFAMRFAVATVTRLRRTLLAIQKGAATLDVTDDEKKQLTDAIDEASKQVDACKSDAASVTDFAGAMQISDKATKAVTDTRQQLVDILGPEDAQQLMKNVLQSISKDRKRAGSAGDATPATQAVK